MFRALGSTSSQTYIMFHGGRDKTITLIVAEFFYFQLRDMDIFTKFGSCEFLICSEAVKTSQGSFMQFEPVTVIGDQLHIKELGLPQLHHSVQLNSY